MRLILATIILLASTSTAALADRVAAPAKPQPVACTMEAKICPDGSSVSRSGPNCEFARCPDGSTPTTQTPAPPPAAPSDNNGGDMNGSGAPGATPGSDATGSGGADSDGGTPDDTPPPGDADE